MTRRRNAPKSASLLLFALLTGAACTGSEDGNGAAPTPTTVVTGDATGDPSVYSALPVPPGQIDAAVAQLDGIVDDAMDRTGVPGMAVAVVHDDEVVYAKGFGVRQVGSDDAVDEQTVFQLASLSKPLGATVVAGVVGDGTVSWDDPVVEHLPDFELSDPYVTEHVTIGDLYAHRSGLPHEAGDYLEDLGYGRDEVLRRLRFEPLQPFRITYNYANFGLTAGAEATAAAAGTSWEELTRTRLYEELGMASTSSTYADFQARDNKALGNVRVDGEWQATPEQRQPDAQSPAGGASSNAVDMAAWLRLLLADGQFDGTQVVDAAALGQALTPQITSNPPRSIDGRPGSYGFGVNVSVDDTGRVRFGHSGAFLLGAGTSVALSPAEDLGIVVLTNGMPIGVAEAVTTTFMDLALTGSISRDWVSALGERFAAFAENPSELAGQDPPADPEPALADSAYVGTYANEYYGPAEVVAVDGGLAVALGPDGTQYPLEHWDGNVFAWEPPGENGVGISKVTFVIGPTGRATDVTFEHLDKNGLGTFRRG